MILEGKKGFSSSSRSPLLLADLYALQRIRVTRSDRQQRKKGSPNRIVSTYWIYYKWKSYIHLQFKRWKATNWSWMDWPDRIWELICVSPVMEYHHLYLNVLWCMFIVRSFQTLFKLVNTFEYFCHFSSSLNQSTRANRHHHIRLNGHPNLRGWSFSQSRAFLEQIQRTRTRRDFHQQSFRTF